MARIKIFLRRFLQFILSAAHLYLVAALIGMLWIQNPHFSSYTGEDALDIYVYSNGFHSSLLIPLDLHIWDWDTFLCADIPACIPSNSTYLRIGWGDKAFFAETPTWQEASLSNALQALFLPTASALQVSYHDAAPRTQASMVSLSIHPETYKALCLFIQNSFETNPDGAIIPITGSGYGRNDMFFEATYTYSLFFTCNNWINTGLKTAAIRCGTWTPLDFTLLYPLRALEPAKCNQ